MVLSYLVAIGFGCNEIRLLGEQGHRADVIRSASTILHHFIRHSSTYKQSQRSNEIRLQSVPFKVYLYFRSIQQKKHIFQKQTFQSLRHYYFRTQQCCCVSFSLVNKETLFHMKDNTRQDVGLFSFLLCKLKITMGWEDLNMKILKSTLDFWVAFLFVLPTCHGQDCSSMSSVFELL